MFESMPEGGATTVKSGKYGPYSQTVREARTRWVLNPEAEGVPQVVVDLSTTHSPESKRFSTSLTWGTVESLQRHPSDGPGAFSTYCWASDHTMLRVRLTPVARYSEKAMEAEHAEALRLVESGWETFSTVFSEAFERNGLGAEQEA